MICAPAEARPAFRLGVRERKGRECSEDGADDHISAQRGSKVFELLEGGAAARKAGRRKVNVFARWAIQDLDLDMGWPRLVRCRDQRLFKMACERPCRIASQTLWFGSASNVSPSCWAAS